MKRFFPYLTILLLIASTSARGQNVNFSDGFEDGDFTANSLWEGDAGHFTVVAATPNFLLQLQGEDSGGTSCLSTLSSAVEGVWEMYIELQFSPSDANRADIFLMSDIADLKGPVNGYALRAGENGSGDVFRIIRYNDGIETATVLSGTTDISAGGAFRVKVSRTAGGNWSLEVGRGYDGLLRPEGGIQNDYTHTSASWFGVRAIYTSSRADAFFFDFKIDLPPFAVTGASVSGNEVDIAFNRAIDPASVQTGDFMTNKNFGSPGSISFPSADTVRLSYDKAFASSRYTVSVHSVEDLNGNALEENTTAEFIVFGTFAPGDVIINEFMYDPPPGLSEYVELHNTSAKYLDLLNWQIGDATGPENISTGMLVLEPDSFLVISSDTSSLHGMFGNRSYMKMSEFPSLNNTGDVITLHTETGIPADSLAYSSIWGGDDIALERRSASAPSLFIENWGDSPNPGGGTPGAANEVRADLTPPSFHALRVIDKTVLQLFFSERLEEEPALLPSSYSINPEIEIQLIALKRDTVTLFLSGELESGQTYTVTVSGLEDIFGNRLVSAELDIFYLEFAQAAKGDLVINEILYSRKDAAGPEFVELFNTTGKNFDLSGWAFGDASSSGIVTLPKGAVVRPGEYLVLTDHPAFAAGLQNGRYLPNFPSLNNSGDALFIRNKDGLTIDSLFYTSGWGGSEAGRSLERIDPLAASSDPANWKSSTSASGISPGAQNASYEPDEWPPSLLFAKLLPGETIEVRFNEFIQFKPDLAFFWGGIGLSVLTFDPDNADRIILNAPPGRAKDFAKGDLSVQNLSDVKGNSTASDEIALAYPLSAFDVVINEIMFNPLSDTDDNRPDQSEYIELRNIRDFAVSLEGISLHDEPDENGKVRSLVPVSTESKWIPPGGIVLVYADEDADFTQSKNALFFELGSSIPAAHRMRIDRTTLSLASTGDAIYLADSTGATIDSVFYDESWHNPNIIDSRGIALERINPSTAGNDKTNWSSSVHPTGGTPGTENSLYQKSGGFPEQSGIGFRPNPFSPDDDGIDDHLFINYRLDEADYLIKVMVYDRYGREVRKLADGLPAGYEGKLIWDGRKDDGSRNRIGIYIVVFEAYNSATGRNLAYKKTVVLARRLK